MELVLPPVAGEAFPVAEERRLFYGCPHQGATGRVPSRKYG